MPTARTRSLLTLLTGAALFVSAVPALAHESASPPSGQAVSRAARTRAEQLTTSLVQLTLQYQAAGAGQKPGLEQSLLAAASTREQELLALMEVDAGEFLRVAIPAGVRSGMPAGVQAHVEEETDIDGILEVVHEDGFTYSRFHYHLETAMGRLALHFANQDAPDDLLTGSRVRVTGMRLGHALAADGSSTGSVQALATVAPNTFDAQKALVMLVNFEDRTTQPFTADAARTMTFTTVSDYYKGNSYGQTWLVGDVVGWYTIPLSYTVCDTAAIRTYARQAATAAGVNVSAYNRHIFAFPSNACSWSGLGSVGGNPSYAMIKGSYSLRVVAHELGHNFGLYHSRSLDCGATATGTTCTVGEYGDVFDVMGGSASGHFNAFQKERLGWLDYGVSPPLTTVTESGTYAIDALEPLGGQPRALKVFKSADSSGRSTFYYMEYRQGVPGGVIFHLGTSGVANSSNLLDMTPETSSWSDSPLAVAATFHDSERGLTVAPVTGDGTRASVSVAFGPLSCVRSDPTLTLSPSQSQWMAAGSTATYTATLTNNDNGGCAATAFSMQAAPPAGWAAAFADAGLSVAPGATVSTTMSVASAPSAADGFYTISSTGADTGNGRSATASATYVVMSSLTASVATDRPSYSGMATVTITTSVRAAGAAVPGASVTVVVTPPAVGKGTRATTLTTQTDTSGVGVVTLRLKKGSPAGVYQVESRAGLNGLASQASTSFAVQ